MMKTLNEWPMFRNKWVPNNRNICVDRTLKHLLCRRQNTIRIFINTKICFQIINVKQIPGF